MTGYNLKDEILKINPQELKDLMELQREELLELKNLINGHVEAMQTMLDELERSLKGGPSDKEDVRTHLPGSADLKPDKSFLGSIPL